MSRRDRAHAPRAQRAARHAGPPWLRAGPHRRRPTRGWAADARHIVFGGGEPEHAADRSGLRETFDGGRTATIVEGPPGIDFRTAGIPAAAPVGAGGRDLLLVVDDGRAHRVFRRTLVALASARP